MGLFGGGDVFGRKPKYQTPEAAALQANEANLNILPKAQELGSKVNVYNQNELLAMFRRVVPGFDERIKLSGDVLTSRLKGEFSKSELDQMSMAQAALGISRGTGGGSPFDKAHLARTLGLNQWKETQEALDSNARWTESMARLTQPAMFNIGSAFVTNQQQIDYNAAKAVADAAPNAKKRGNLDTHLGLVGMATSGYAGGAGYTNAYRPSTPSSPSAPQYTPNWTGGTSGNYLAASSPGYGSTGPYE